MLSHMRIPNRFLFQVVIAFVLFAIFISTWAQSSSYNLHKEDKIQLTFWENPELNTEIVIGNDGEIELPIVGRIMAAGSTIEQLRNRIISKMGRYDKVINHLSIVVLEYGLNKVFVTGQVEKPGKYSFEKIPNIWEIILEAGGPLETARLTELYIVRAKEEGKIISIDLNSALQTGNINKLPQIYPGDTIHIPGDNSPFNLVNPSTNNKNEIYVLGAVTIQGPIIYSGNMNLLEVISKAGGPAMNANLKNIKYVENYKNNTKVMEINLENYIKQSLTIPIPKVTPGSTIFIPRKRQLSPFMITLITTAVSTAITSIIFVTVTR